MAEVQLDIPARVEYLALARQVVAAAAEVEPRFRDERIDDLRLAVSEATTNAIESHADLSSDDRILIRCNLDDERIEVQVLDQGGGFDPGCPGRPRTGSRGSTPLRARARYPAHEDVGRRDRDPVDGRWHRRSPRRLYPPPPLAP